MKTVFLFFLLTFGACVLAKVHYELPKLPCGWTFTMTFDDKINGYNLTKQVNGAFMKTSVIQPHDYDILVVRSDLGDSETTVKEFTHSKDEPNATDVVAFDRLKYYYQPLLFSGNRFSFDFDHVKDSWFHGKKCKKYYNDNTRESEFHIFLADLDGFPLGLEKRNGDIILMSFVSTLPPLKTFTFGKSVTFEDTRIYVPPEHSICTPSSSSSSGYSSSSD